MKVEHGSGGVPRGYAAKEAERTALEQHEEAQISGAILSPNKHLPRLLRPQL